MTNVAVDLAGRENPYRVKKGGSSDMIEALSLRLFERVKR
jgi:hypothetical protein